MDSAFHQQCPKYSGSLTPTAPMAVRLWETFYFYLDIIYSVIIAVDKREYLMIVFLISHWNHML